MRHSLTILRAFDTDRNKGDSDDGNKGDDNRYGNRNGRDDGDDEGSNNRWICGYSLSFILRFTI